MSDACDEFFSDLNYLAQKGHMQIWGNTNDDERFHVWSVNYTLAADWNHDPVSWYKAGPLISGSFTT